MIDDILGDVLARMDGPERLAFVRRVVERTLNQLAVRLSREERVELMNALLPRLAQTFPLAELDILGAFASLEDEEPTREGG